MTPEHLAKMQAGRKKKQAERKAVEEPPKKPEPEKEEKAEPNPIDQLFKVDGDVQDIWERRQLNPEQKASEPIRLKRNGMHLRWINLANNGRYQRARYEEGWQPVHKDALVDEREVYGVSYTTEGYVCRGEKQNEMLMWMPEAVFKTILKKKQSKVEESQRKIRQSLMSDGAKYLNEKYGGSAGEETVDRMTAKPGTAGAFRGSINFGSEAVVPDEEESQMIVGG